MLNNEIKDYYRLANKKNIQTIHFKLKKEKLKKEINTCRLLSVSTSSRYSYLFFEQYINVLLEKKNYRRIPK